jgi:hypothetical protein
MTARRLALWAVLALAAGAALIATAAAAFSDEAHARMTVVWIRPTPPP